MKHFPPRMSGPFHYIPHLLFFLIFIASGATLGAQTQVTGTVSDEQGVALIGVSVRAESSPGTGTVTDLDGNFTLSVPEGETNLVFTYIGYARKTVPLNNRTRLKIRMNEDVEELQEVVVVAYGQAKKADIVGSVDQVTAKEIENIQVNSFDQILAGQAAGVQIRTGTGRPDGGGEILLRGVGTSGDNAPLLVIDGVPYGNYNSTTNNFLALVNPDDIESISVIRDASGAALYGSRAGNGLIVIQTKRGRKGKPTISLNLSTAVQTIPDFERPDNLNATELAQFLQERELDDGVAPEDISEEFLNPERYGEGTDWFDLITRNGTRHNANLAVRGGTDAVRYNVSAGYTGNEGIVKNTNFDRYTLRATLDADVTPWLRFGTVLAPSQTISNVAGIDPGTGQFQAYHIIQVARWADPSAPAYDENGDLTLTTKGDLLPFFQANPLYRLENTRNTETNRQLLSQFTFDADLFKGMVLSQRLGYNLIFNRGRFFRSGSVVGQGLTPNNPDPPANSNAQARRYENQRLLSETLLRYQRTAGRHNFNSLLGYVAEYTQEIFFNGGGSRLINEDFPLLNSGNIETFLESDPETTRIFFNTNESESEQALVSYIGQLKYNFDQKYYVDLSIRRDASSRFGPGLQAAVFPAIGLAWRASKEPWFPQGGIINDLRFELSVGQTGNNRIGNYQYQGNIGQVNYILGNAQAQGFTVTGLPNQLLKWEEVDQTDIGVEIGFFKDRLRLEATYYDKTTNDLLNSSPIPRISGFGGIISNIGTINNKGIELQLSTKPVVKDDLVWTFDANFSANRNEVIQLGCCNVPIFSVRAGNSTTITRTIVGEPIGQYYGLQILGLYTPEDLADPSIPVYPGATVGSPRYLDGDGDGRLESQDDYVFLGNPLPDFTYGFTSFLTYKDFGLRIIANGEHGALIYDLSREVELNTDGVFNPRREVLDRFRPGSTDFSLRAPTTETAASSQRYRWPNSLAVQNGNFLRIGTITLTYKLDALLQRVPGIRAATLSLSAQNPFIFSPFYGNPQSARSSGAFERNINYNAYPSARTFSVGLNVNL